MHFALADRGGMDDLFFLALVAAVAASASFSVFLGCFLWLRREQRRWQRRILGAMERNGAEIFPATDRDGGTGGELIAQLKVNQGRQVLSVMESDGRRFVRIEGELSHGERDRLIRYLKSEGFMS